MPNPVKSIKQALETTRPNVPILSKEEQQIIQMIHSKTVQANLNNLTRTAAYFHFYQQYPELKWPFLAHMVSRNGGWNMTDLKSSLQSQLLTPAQQHYFFSFLERNNWLIFQDAYPQLLLYQESMKRQTNLTHLLPYFHVSIFMQVLWNHFFNNRNSYLIDTALIINEQHYIEKRVIQNKQYQPTLKEKIDMRLPELFQWNYILLPYLTRQGTQIVGLPVQHFHSLKQRILLGKKLLHIISQPVYHQAMVEWAESIKHSGSRSDYWPHVFTHHSTGNYIYSPTLPQAWENIKHQPALFDEWFHDDKVLTYFRPIKKNIHCAIAKDYVEALQQLHTAAAVQSLFDQN
ncbi:DUF2515 family protein [Gracilibacillus alcaliphilus]|uniref:DUF2515 family protein n=1 Tax=Gracilibacillus alcaliphilus TaxID=1401441 RepID=UPI0019592295|nr:DUF2515 family protein [Gracilibacillus alcaliphilus]MBM7678864.1 hypothetical protein [Gracilibacillus alcaliphilus]